MIQERIGGMSTRFAFVLMCQCQVLFVASLNIFSPSWLQCDCLGLLYLFLTVIFSCECN